MTENIICTRLGKKRSLATNETIGSRFLFSTPLDHEACCRFLVRAVSEIRDHSFAEPSRIADDSMTSTTTKRRKALVDPEVQGGILRKIAIHWVLFFICNAMALMIWIRLFEQPDADWGQTFGDTMRRFLPFFIITMALIPAFVWDTLKLTNRFAGPILRLRSALSDASAGRAVTPLHFRTNDFWQEIAQNFNSVIERCSPADAATEQDSSEPPADA